MANTYTLIASNTLSSSAASVTFSSIPSTYTDLVLKLNAKSSRDSNFDNIAIQLNGDTAANYSNTYLTGSSSTAVTNSSSSQNYLYIISINGSASTVANTFGPMDIYIPSYTVSQNKPISGFGVQENNNTAARLSISANLWRNTATVSSIVLTPQVGANFVSGSSFFLYGIKNS